MNHEDYDKNNTVLPSKLFPLISLSKCSVVCVVQPWLLAVVSRLEQITEAELCLRDRQRGIERLGEGVLEAVQEG